MIGDIEGLTKGLHMSDPVTEAEQKYCGMIRNLSLDQIQTVQNGNQVVIGESPVMHAARQAYNQWQKLLLDYAPH